MKLSCNYVFPKYFVGTQERKLHVCTVRPKFQPYIVVLLIYIVMFYIIGTDHYALKWKSRYKLRKYFCVKFLVVLHALCTGPVFLLMFDADNVIRSVYFV